MTIFLNVDCRIVNHCCTTRSDRYSWIIKNTKKNIYKTKVNISMNAPYRLSVAYPLH